MATAAKKQKVVQMRIAKITEMARRKELQAGILMERAQQLYERVEAIETGQKPKTTKYRLTIENLDRGQRAEVYDYMIKKMGKSKAWVYLAINVNPDEKYKAKFDMHFDYIIRLLGYKVARLSAANGANGTTNGN